MLHKQLATLANSYNETYQAPLKVVAVSGKDCKNFLQGQLSCNLDDVTGHTVTPGLYCNRQGKIICDFLLLSEKDRYLIILHESMPEKFIDPIKHFAMFSKVDFEIIACKAGFKLNQEERVELSYETDIGSSYVIQTTGIDIMVSLSEQIQFQEEPTDIWKSALILKTQPQITATLSEKYLPHRLGYHERGYLNFNKGCYLGQEIIARMHYKSQHKHALAVLTLDKITIKLEGQILATEKNRIKLDCITQATLDNKTILLVSCDKQAMQENLITFQDNTYSIEWAQDE